ncbi:MAG TPA: hypothetical protein VNE39_02450 [Planctomycetota bacterium]|nr:hypothetical protein [Planctomycetota bacterium]
MKLRTALLAVLVTTLVGGALGLLIGCALGELAPGYYRAVFADGREPGFDPVAVGAGLGLTQGLGAGLFVGLVVVIVVSWRRPSVPGERTRGAGRAARSALIFLLSALFATGFSCFPQLWQSHEAVFTEAGLLTARAEELKSTTISAHLEEPLRPGRNVLWCSTFQLAWNEACTLIGEDIHLQNDPPLIAFLNKKSATKSDLDEASYVALAGFVRDDIYQKIDKALNEKFRGAATPRYNQPMGAVRPQDFVAYSYLFKHLEFPTPFQRPRTPLVFRGTRVASFGFEGYSASHDPLYKQVVLIEYKSADDFIIELKTKSEGDRFLLAKVAPESDLARTITSVQARVANATLARVEAEDVLKVPKLNFDLTREYRELYGQMLRVANPNVAKDIGILTAIQNIRCQLDERGVRLRSESHVAFGCAAAAPPRHIMVFDRPFLMLLQRADAKLPYFALWVETPELLVR